MNVRHWHCPACGAVLDRDVNAAKNIKEIAIADALGQSVCVKSSPEAVPFSDGALATDAIWHGSQEALTTVVLAI